MTRTVALRAIAPMLPVLVSLVTGAVAQEASHVERLNLAGPTVVAFVALTQQDVADDTTGGLAAAVDDFQWYLPRIGSALKARGVDLVVASEDTLLLAMPGGPQRAFVARDSVRLGYLFWGPEREPRVLWGVMTDNDVLCAAQRYFGWPQDSTTAECH
jgi:hypothetical protein